MWYIAKENGRWVDGTTLFFDQIDPVSGSSNFFAYFANIILPGSPPSITTPNAMLEAYYTKVPTSECNIGQNAMATLTNLNTSDPERVWELEGGVKMTGAQLMKAMGQGK
jgi:hypothetical protein